MTTPTVAAIGPAWWATQVEGVDQIVKAFRKKLVDFIDHAPKLSAVKMALHELNHVIDQHVALRLHDVGGRRSHKHHHKVIA